VNNNNVQRGSNKEFGLTFLDLSNVLSMLFAGMSVLVAIYIYHRNTEREYFRGFRGALVNYRQLLDEASELFDEVGLVEIGYSISRQLRNISKTNLSPKEVQEFFYDKKNENYLRQAIYLGIGESKTIIRAKEISREIHKIPSVHREAFPITNSAFGILNAYYSAMVNTISSGDIISNLFANVRENRAPKEQENENITTDTDLIFREIGVYITILHTDMVNNLAESLFEQADVIAGIISHTYELKSDSELRKISNKEKKEANSYEERAKAVKSPKALFEILKFYRPYVTEGDWDSLVECKTIMETVVKGAEDE